MTQSGRTATRFALLGVALTLVTIALAVIIVTTDLPLLVRAGLGIVGGLTLIGAGATIGYAIAVIRLRDEDNDEDED
ncbi:hypothetical protein [Microbacterium sp. MPKO10]|uniref:hypothetical protein n=1 Tax=Microbacterium sp. MPKO10 TaxID=2989818 RepID=UPI00223697C6|nr:hypothetical protein [Microbacterium sp. MPKO10]MCW4457214.1 hypothetical protein [Microbacterium sp. MPKO10]